MHGSSSFKITYTINDAPPLYLCVLLGLQQFLTMVGGTIAAPLLVGAATCVGQDLVGRAQILGTLMLVNGICTLVQTLLGARLPIIQGASLTFIAPMMAMQNMEEFKCPILGGSDGENGTIVVGSDEHRAIWMSRLAEIQGAMLIAGAFEAILGAIGVIGILLRAIGPLTIAPTIGLVGLSFADDIVSNYASKYWPVAILSLALVVLFSLYLSNVPVPLPRPTLINRKIGCVVVWFRIFGLFPVLLSIALVWAVCALLTTANALSNSPSSYGYLARTDIHLSEFAAANWVRFPYPGQWGCPRVSLAIVLGMVSGIIATMIETVGDFYACARLCGVRPPPPHAINRGIFVEGLGCMLSGALGCGPGVTSYAENIGAIAITGVASRRVFYVAAGLLFIFGFVTKIAAVFALIPDPIVGGVLIAMLSMVSAVGFSNLQFLDLNCTRNLLIFGLSMFLGISMPMWVKNNQKMIKTGSEVVDQVLVVLLSTGMLVGGLIGFGLDNTVPGATREQRGMNAFSGAKNDDDDKNGVEKQVDDIFDLPFIGFWIRKRPSFRLIPISPNFDPAVFRKCGTKRVENNVPETTSCQIQDMSSV